MKAALCLLCLLLFASCVPLTGLQSGRSLGKGNTSISPYLHGGNIYIPQDDSEHFSSFLPGAGAQFVTGLTDKLDIGCKLDYNSFMAFNVKYQFLGTSTSKFAGSIGAEAGVMLAPLLIGGVFYYYTLPVFISYHPTEKLCFFSMPAYSFGQRYVVNNANGNGKSETWHSREQAGFSYGFSIGAKNRFSLEIGHYNYKLYQPTKVGVGYTFLLSD